MTVKSLHYYPVKSCAGIDLSRTKVSKNGIENDRIFMIIDENNVFLSQRKFPKMALIKPNILKDSITLSAPDMPSISINFSNTGLEEQVLVWNDDCLAIDQGTQSAEWLSSFLEISCKLVMMERSFQRKLDPGFALSENNQTGFADGFPFLLISQESLNDLNSRLKRFIPMNRFRPNIVVEGCSAYDEDRWRKIKIGGIIFEIVKPCIRCVITTIDQSTLKSSKEPLSTLATYRMSPLGGVMFGQNLIHHNSGNLCIDDTVQVLELR